MKYVIALVVLLVALTGFSLYMYRENLLLKKQVETEITRSKNLEQEIVRASTQYIKKEDIEAILQQNNINYQIIKKDLEQVRADLLAINITTSSSKPQNQNSPSSSIIDKPGSNNQKPIDFNGWYAKIARLDLFEDFDKVKVPFGYTAFDASADPSKAWNYQVYQRNYRLLTTISEDENRKITTHSSFQLNVDNKNYLIPIKSETLQVIPESKFRFNPNVFLGFGMGISGANFDVSPDLSLSLLSYGKYKVNPEFSLLQLGMGYSLINKNINISLTPVAYNLNSFLPFLKNTYVYSSINYSFDNNIAVYLGIKVNL